MYQDRYRDPAELTLICRRKQYQMPLLACLRCKHFPCISIKPEHEEALRQSLFVNRFFEGYRKERLKMPKYLFAKSDGSVVEAPEDFSPENPDFSKMSDVLHVIPYQKILVPQMKLVVKNVDEISNIRKQQTERKAAPDAQKSTGKRGRASKRTEE